MLAVLAAFVPVSAFGLNGNSAPAAAISVSASLGSCGVAEQQVYCSIDVSFSAVPGTDYYTAAVTRADGSVQDFGQIAHGDSGGGTSLWVPYVGPGTYAVQVAAYGTPPGQTRGRPRLLDQGTANPQGGYRRVPTGPIRRGGTATHSAPARHGGPVPSHAPKTSGGAPRTATPAAPSAPAPAPSASPPASGSQPTATTPQTTTTTTTDPTVTLPECQPNASSESDKAPDAGTPSAGPPIECTTSSTDAQGSCCPAGG
jgi:hypothetical protein